MVCRELDDPVREADLLRALARRGEKYLGSRRMGVFLEEVMLDFPGEVVAQAVRQFDLCEGVVEELVFALLPPRPRQLMLVEDAELHRGSLSACLVMPLSPRQLTGIGSAAHAVGLEPRERAQCPAEELMCRFAGEAPVEECIRVEADEDRVHKPSRLARCKPVRRLRALEECLEVLPPGGRVLCPDLTKARVMDREP